MIKSGEDVSDIFTIFDTNVQLQAWLTENLWIEINKIFYQNDKEKIIDIISNIWLNNYTTSLDLMEQAIIDLKNISGTSTIIQMIDNITLSINRSKNYEAIALCLNSSGIEEKSIEDLHLIDQFEYEMDFEYLLNEYKYSDRSI